MANQYFAESDGDDSGDDLPDTAFSQFDLQAGDSQDTSIPQTTSFSTPPPLPDTVDEYLKLGRPFITILVMERLESRGMYHACMREGHKSRLRDVSGGKTIVIYSRKPSVFQEVTGYTRIWILSRGERAISNATTAARRATRLAVRRVSRSCAAFLVGPQLWAAIFTTAIIGACVLIASLCLAFGKWSAQLLRPRAAPNMPISSQTLA